MAFHFTAHDGTCRRRVGPVCHASVALRHADLSNVAAAAPAGLMIFERCTVMKVAALSGRAVSGREIALCGEIAAS